MNIRIVSLALALAIHSPAQEPNPFVKKPADGKTELPPGPGFVSVFEHILVPPEKIDAWMDQHGIPGDAEGLRAEAQEWIDAGEATLDFTGITTATTGRKFINESIFEQIYACDYMPQGPGVWPAPTSFEVRNVGISIDSERKEADTSLWINNDYVEMHPAVLAHPLVERTCKPGDVFIPRFRSHHVTASSQAAQIRRVGQALATDGIEFVSRHDPLTSLVPEESRSRLIFHHSAPSGTEKASPLPERFHLSIRAVQVPHAAFSNFVRETPVAELSTSAWDFVSAARAAGTATILDAIDGLVEHSNPTILENILEIVYPTEWAPVEENTFEERRPEGQVRGNTEGAATLVTKESRAVPGMGGAFIPTSFETRNSGLSAEINPVKNVGDGLVTLSISRILKLADSVHRRVENQGEWVPDIRFPVFANNTIDTSLRLEPGKWMLVGSGSEFTAPGERNPEHCLLFFVKAQ